MTAISTALGGVLRATASFDRAAHDMNKALRGEGDKSLVTTVTDQIKAEHAHNANLSVLRTASDMEKRVLDILV